MIVDIGEDILKSGSLGLLNKILADKTTNENIMWATDAYRELGEDYERDQEIRADLISGQNIGVLKTRAQKASGKQSERTKQHAEVFTPLWIVQKMNDHADEVWFGYPNVFIKGDAPTSEVRFFDNKRTWQMYVDSRRLEITCGEAPYLVTRYNVETGEIIPIVNRVGILDRKLRVVTENTQTEEDWLKWAFRALQATYGYEFQGDNLLIARLNVLATFEEYYFARWQKRLAPNHYTAACRIIVWNIWQMDGLTRTIPYCKGHEKNTQLTMYDFLDLEDRIQVMAQTQPRCIIYNWRAREPKEFTTIKAGEKRMKFDFIIGNPPYQDETLGENATYAPPIYHLFMDESYKISDCVELIHPARFLFNAGSTPKEWNKKMLADTHFKVLYYEQDSSKVFVNTDIKGGVAVTYRNSNEDYGAIETFTAFDELNSIMKKVYHSGHEKSFSSIVVTRTAYRLTDKMHEDYPNAINQLSNGHPYDMSTNIFDRLPQIFYKDKPDDGYEYIQILGREENKRVYKYVRRDYVNKVKNLDKYKVFVPKSNGSGALGEVLTTPLIGQPLIGHTESFISIGWFDIENEANACYKYVCTKFCRCLLGVLKVTQDNPPDKWKYVPLQDFTVNSDIDWNQSVAGIDRQLYAKYGLDEREIEFIESHVKEMK